MATAETLAAGQVGGEAGVVGERPASAERYGEARAELPEKFVIPEGYEELPRIARVPFYVPEKQPDKNPSIPIYVGSHRVNVVQDHEGAKLVFYEMLDPECHVNLRTIGRDGQVEGTKELNLGLIPLEAGTEILIKGSGEDGEAVVVVDDNLRETTLPSDSDKIKKVLVVKIPRTVRTEKGAVDFSDIDPLLHAVIIYSKDGIVSVQRISEKVAIYVPGKLIEALMEAGSRFVPPEAMVRSADAPMSLGEAREERAGVEVASVQAEQRELPAMTEDEQKYWKIFTSQLEYLAKAETGSGVIDQGDLRGVESQITLFFLLLHKDIKQVIIDGIVGQMGKKPEEADQKPTELFHEWLEKVLIPLREKAIEAGEKGS